MLLDSSDNDYQNHIIKRFKKAAFIYDLSFTPLAWIRRLVIKNAEYPRQKVVLDACTGTGEQALAFAHLGNEVHAVDLSSEMLEIAKRKKGADRIVFSLSDCSSLDYPADFFDLAVISFGLHEMPPSARKATLKEIHRVLKNNADFIVVDYAMPRNRLVRFFALIFLKFYECEYYSEYVRSDNESLIAGRGFILKTKIVLVSGSVSIMRFRAVKTEAIP